MTEWTAEDLPSAAAKPGLEDDTEIAPMEPMLPLTVPPALSASASALAAWPG